MKAEELQNKLKMHRKPNFVERTARTRKGFRGSESRRGQFETVAWTVALLVVVKFEAASMYSSMCPCMVAEGSLVKIDSWREYRL